MSDQYGAPGRVLREAAPARPKRFYAVAQVEEREGLFALLLDGRSARTPGKRILALPSLASAERVAAEWNAQVDTIDPLAMPLTRIANSAIDGVAEQMQAVADEVRTYLTSDLVVYRAAAPAVLVEAEAVAWDPVLDWVRDTFHVRFILAEGLAFVQQPASTLAHPRQGYRRDRRHGPGRAVPSRRNPCDHDVDGLGAACAGRHARPALARRRLVGRPCRRDIPGIAMGSRCRGLGATGEALVGNAGRSGHGPAGRSRRAAITVILNQ